jgi:hypothetical protein
MCIGCYFCNINVTDRVFFYINVIIDYECAFDYRNMIIDLPSWMFNIGLN